MKKEKHKRHEQTRQKGPDTRPDSNPDPITKESGSQVVGTSAGGASGALAGGAIGGAVGGPLGAAVGAGIGAVAGGLGGKALGKVVNPTEEDHYWRENFQTRPYYKEGLTYEAYQPAYRYGWESAARPEYRGKRFEEIEKQLAVEWPSYSNSKEEFIEYRPATEDAYNRVFQRISNTGEHAAASTDSAWQRIRENWNDFRDAVKNRWSRLTDQDIEGINGDRRKFVGKVHERYGPDNWKESDIDREIYEISRHEPATKI